MQTDTVEQRLTLDPPIPGVISWEGTTLVFQPEVLWPAGEQIRLSLESGARSASWLPLPLLRTNNMEFQVSPRLIAYLYPTSGPADLYILDPDGGLPERLISTPGGISGYSVTSDGRMIYYASAGGTLYRYDRYTGENRTVVTCTQAVCGEPRISPDGRYLAYERLSLEGGIRSVPQVWIKTLPEGEERPVNESALTTRLPAWSSNGWLAYYDEGGQQYILWNPESGEEHRVPNLTGEPGAWLADGSGFIAPEIYLIPNAYVGATGDLESMPTSHLLNYQLENRQVIDLTQEQTLEDTSPAPSPDGSLLIFARKYLDPSRWTPGRQIWSMQLDGNQESLLTDDPFYNHTGFNWSQDSSQIVYVRTNQTNLSAPLEIWRMKADGSQVEQLVIGGFAPVWIP
jgi:Tol biopolymer transport system component